MKNRIFKLLVLTLSLILVIGASVITTAAENEETTPTIISKNLEYGEKFAIMYAVDAATVAEGPVTLKVYAQAPAEGVAALRTYTSAAPETIEINGVETSAYVFITEGIAPKDMADEFYAQATDASGKVGAAVKYSVVEYLLERLYGGYDLEDTQIELYKTAHAFGVATQNRFAAGDAIRMNDYKYVRVVDGTVNGVEKGMFLAGTPLTLSANAKGWQAVVNGETTKINGTSYTVVDNAIIETYVRPLDLTTSYYTTQTAAGELGFYYDNYAGTWTFNAANDSAANKFMWNQGYTGDNSESVWQGQGLATIDGKGKVLAIYKNGTPTSSLSHRVPEVAFNNLNSTDKNCLVFESEIYVHASTSDQITASKQYLLRFGFVTAYDRGATNNLNSALGYAEVGGAFDTENNTWGDVYLDGEFFARDTWNMLCVEYYKAEGIIKYYLNGYLVKTVEVTPNTEVVSFILQLQGQTMETVNKVGSYVYLDNTYVGTVDKTLAE